MKTLHFVQWHVLGYNSGTMQEVGGGRGRYSALRGKGRRVAAPTSRCCGCEDVLVLCAAALCYVLCVCRQQHLRLSSTHAHTDTRTCKHTLTHTWRECLSFVIKASGEINANATEMHCQQKSLNIADYLFSSHTIQYLYSAHIYTLYITFIRNEV